MSLPPPTLIADASSLAVLVTTLAAQPVVAVDTESNSLHAYRERVCLIQFSTSDADYIVDPIALRDLTPLATLFANPKQQKIFHAAEYDIVTMRRDFGFSFVNLFDTMSAARTLGWPQVGLAAILETQFGVKMDKKHQRSDWKRRPLTQEQLDYARLDTHYLPALRDKQIEALTATGSLAEAMEEFERLARLGENPDPRPDPALAFWRVKGARELTPPQAAILQALYVFREQQADRQDRPPFKVMAEPTLLEIARRAPRSVAALPGIPGMTPEQIRRYGQGLLQAVSQGLQAPPQYWPHVEQEPDEILERYDRLSAWRKTRARARGVESDVILPKTVLWALARNPARTREDLAAISDLGPWRRELYGDELLKLLQEGRG